ncbi:MAG: 3-isopropylmalate dehydratase large subunit [Treponema sp.]|nr:3-isopropylmalate dehydratase large subunit [Treponema sp.]
MSKNLFDKVWDAHRVGSLPTGQDQLFIGLHLIHEVTSPQAFGMLEERGLKVLYPGRSFATCDHIVPTESRARPFADPEAEAMMAELEKNVKKHGIAFFDFASGRQGVLHVVGPELGLTQPGMTIACGDSHTATHGAVGAIAFGIGTTQVCDVLATQTLAMDRPKVRKIEVSGKLGKGVGAKDIILAIMARFGVEGGLGYAYEYTGEAIRALSMEGRMTLCNMSIEGGARSGYVSPDQTTYDYLKGRPYAPTGADWDRALVWWKSLASAPDASFDDEKSIDGSAIEPMVTWGINPGHAIGVGQRMPKIADLPPAERDVARKAYDYMQFAEGAPIAGTKINVAFVGSCTNGRISDLRDAAALAKGRKVAKGVRALVVPGSMQVDAQARAEGLDKVFAEAGFEYRNPGCSMCLAMNPDKLRGDEVSASSSNRNFIGRQGSPRGRTLLMSPAMVVAAAVAGEVVDSRSL